jgi:tetratricopeptide (TPR) repeat protein
MTKCARFSSVRRPQNVQNSPPNRHFGVAHSDTSADIMLTSRTMNRYKRTDVLRILRITGQQLTQWQKAGLVAAGEAFSFFDLLQLKKIRDLRAMRVRPAVIRASLEAMQKQVAGMENPLLEAGAFPANARVVFRHDGHSVEPTSGQYYMDFVSSGNVVATKLKPMAAASTAVEFFSRGVELEDDPASQQEAMDCYQRVLSLEPGHAAAHINLGTIHYNRREFELAERHYRLAIETDRRYALAHFNLGNVLDETGRMNEAVQEYRTALLLATTYADAHYNLALAYEKLREPRLALRHWRAYLKLDQNGPWSTHAKNEVRKILASDKLKIVYTR